MLYFRTISVLLGNASSSITVAGLGMTTLFSELQTSYLQLVVCQ